MYNTWPEIDGEGAPPVVVIGTERDPALPDVPTFAEGGVANAESYTWHMVLAPSGTPAPVVAAINDAFNRVAAMESVQRRLTDLTMTVRSDTTPDTAARWMAALCPASSRLSAAR